MCVGPRLREGKCLHVFHSASDVGLLIIALKLIRMYAARMQAHQRKSDKYTRPV